MAIALDTSTLGPNPTRGASSETFAHTCTGSNLLLLVGIQRNDDTATAADDVTGVTYNGVSMTQLVKRDTSTQEPGVVYIYGLLAPATGANNVVVSLTGSTGSRAYCYSASYTGVSQSGLPDSSTSAYSIGVTSQTLTTTTVADNSWLFMATGTSDGGVTITAGAGTTLRQNRGGSSAIFDSNAAITPAGSASLISNITASRNIGGCLVSFAPSGAAVASGNAMFMGANF